MEEQGFLVKIVDLIVNNWDVFKYFFLALSVKYFGQGIFEIMKALILTVMGLQKMFRKK